MLQPSTHQSKRREIQCRAHVRGRCTNGAKCTAQHTTDPAEIMCNSTVEPGEKAGIKNKSYGWCHLVAKGIECPYKECIHRESLEAAAPAAMEEEHTERLVGSALLPSA